MVSLARISNAYIFISVIKAVGYMQNVEKDSMSESRERVASDKQSNEGRASEQCDTDGQGSFHGPKGKAK